MSGTIVPLTAGSYKVSGWRQKGDYETVTFVISPGENKEIVLRAK